MTGGAPGAASRAGRGAGAGWTSPFRRLRGIDQMYLALETPATPMHFGALVVLEGAALCDADGRLRLPEIQRQLDVRTRAVPELRRMVHDPGCLAGAPLWVEDPAFRIERHVREAVLPAPGDDAALLRFVELLMAQRLDRSHPLWRLWCITGLSAGRVAMLVEVHHAMADGLGAMRLATALLGAPLVADGEAVAVHALPGPASPPLRRDLLVRDHVHAVVAAVRQLTDPATWRAVVAFVRSFRAGWSATRREPPTSLNAVVGPRRRLVVLRLDQSNVRRVARAHDGGVNDVVLGLLAGGVHALLGARGEPVKRLAPRAGIAVALPPSLRGDAGNHFGSYVVPLPIGEPDPVQRLVRIRDAWGRAKRTQAVTGVTGVRVWTTRFAPTRDLMGRQRFINVMETYLPGPPRRVRLLGATVLDLVPIQPLGRNVGLTVLASSYAGCLTLTVRADPDAFPDLDVLLGGMERDWQALATATPL